MREISVFCLAIALVACAKEPNQTGQNTTVKRSKAEMLQEIVRVANLKTVYLEFPQAGYTYLLFYKGMGFQVVYFDRNNNSLLWFPNLPIVTATSWKIQDNNVCFYKGAGTYPSKGSGANNKLVCKSHFLIKKEAGPDWQVILLS
ncbi:hypothetical protein [Pseudovibrio sp. Tun.PSC04-5.I4]|uniref:hypothetical protein n=1 Tax=Pseudovibrio sp. Tun.PSC04-5.I4 TaxID=1798213 RepID=UPI0008826EEA|nr:hypothetical protein [Pseudovibrio sp. Tun.PSC04-5.I4]SDR04894.1 hypothetical protein SAMN04515695_2495 [Pseudovibrio sp. Tun.PSC04-5.I4]